ncbi:MAG: hypothetical protein LBQ12_02100, partial [Deltaproteobacteria bacterium]|nr:hypothetical protein [Deltaproteobacteria bacterium]
MNFIDNSVEQESNISNVAISKARTRLGSDVMRRIADKVVSPIAYVNQPGAWYKNLRLMAVDGTTIDLPDEVANAEFFGYPSSSRSDSA